MKALTYEKAHSLDQFSIQLSEVNQPTMRDMDLLVKVKATGFNPIDYKIRKARSSQDGKPVILGWDAAGIVEAVGVGVTNFTVGDEVYYAGDLNREGSYAEYQAVDSRLVAKKPKHLSFSEAAAIPLTAITAYEALILQTTTLYQPHTTVLVIGGAGGVGSMSIQLLKTLTPAKVIATASRSETMAWCKTLGADEVIDHTKNLEDELRAIGVDAVDFVFSTTNTEQYLPVFPEVIRPFGHLTLIDDVPAFDIRSFKLKSITLNFELMFTRSMFNYDLESQGKLLAHVASLIDDHQLKTTLSREWVGLSPEHVLAAHTLLESGKSVGKSVMRW